MLYADEHPAFLDSRSSLRVGICETLHGQITSAIKYGLYDVGREQAQLQNAWKIQNIEFFSRRKLVDCCIRFVLKPAFSSESTGDCLSEAVIEACPNRVLRQT